MNHDPSKLVIAIDGPAGAGKSTVAKALAAELHLRYLDTGAMYRTVALMATRHQISANEGDRAAELAKKLDIRFEEGSPQRVLVNGEDITDLIRTPEIGELASALSAYRGLREVLVERQQAMIEEGGFTLEGRDTTTVVAPHADLKVFLTASLEERAKRRHLELFEKGTDVTYDEILRQISERDHRDYTREDSPLHMAEGSHRIESYGVPPETIVNQILSLVKNL
jgi:cytidylate kinase